MRAFRRRRGYYVAELEGDEATILSRVVADTAMLLGERLDTGAATGTSTDTSANTGPEATGPDTDRNPETTGTAATGPDADQSPEPGTPQDPLQAMAWPTEGVSAPTDPALARLLPDASEDDDELNAEFRRLTESDLRRTKVARLRTVWETLRRGEGQLRIPVQDGMDWAAALNDVRLVISERLEITTEAEAEAIQQRAAGAVAGSEDEVRQALGMVYSALSWLQESLLQVMLPTLED